MTSTVLVLYCTTICVHISILRSHQSDSCFRADKYQSHEDLSFSADSRTGKSGELNKIVSAVPYDL